MTANDVTPQVLRQISVRAVMDVLLHRGATSRADLAKATGLSKQTMSEVIRVLEDGGWVRVKGITTGRVGRAAVTYEVSPEAGFVIGADLGATTIRLAVANIVGKIVASLDTSSDMRGGRHLIHQLEGLKSQVLAQAGISPSKVLFAAVATPGVIDPGTGTLSLAPNVSDVGNFDFAGALAEAMDCDVVIENDINAAVIGESWNGCAVGYEEVAFISLGTGVGLGALVNGKLLRGATGAAGEISYLPLGGDPLAPQSLDRGTLECAIGAKGICERYQSLGGGAQAGAHDILAKAEAGEAIALDALRETARTAALLVVSIHAVLDPRKIVIGGAIGRHPLVVEMIRAEIPARSRREIPVEASTLGPHARLNGALAIALNQVHNALFSPQALPQRMRLPAAAQ